ncbi:MAG: hypothetical protein HQK55_07550 [Deltaproteobacteria bacterium]|nr:hypothetical protein [Deltaproteobacteria bacterium]
MKPKLSFYIIAALLFGAIAFTAGVYAAEQHEHMHAAQKSLGHAYDSLQHAALDYQGHRTRAMELIRAAQDEIKLGLASEKK